MTSSSNKVDADGVERSECFTKEWVEPRRWETNDSCYTCWRKATAENVAFAWEFSAVIKLATSWRKTSSSGTQLESFKNSNMVAWAQRELRLDKAVNTSLQFGGVIQRQGYVVRGRESCLKSGKSSHWPWGPYGTRQGHPYDSLYVAPTRKGSGRLLVVSSFTELLVDLLRHWQQLAEEGQEDSRIASVRRTEDIHPRKWLLGERGRWWRLSIREETCTERDHLMKSLGRPPPYPKRTPPPPPSPRSHQNHGTKTCHRENPRHQRCQQNRDRSHTRQRQAHPPKRKRWDPLRRQKTRKEDQEPQRRLKRKEEQAEPKGSQQNHRRNQRSGKRLQGRERRSRAIDDRRQGPGNDRIRRRSRAKGKGRRRGNRSMRERHSRGRRIGKKKRRWSSRARQQKRRHREWEGGQPKEPKSGQDGADQP